MGRPDDTSMNQGDRAPTSGPGRAGAVAASVALVAFALLAARRAERIDDLAQLPVASIRIDVNQAGAAELALLPEVGPSMAEAILADRARHGPFATVDDLRRVRGIGPATLEAIRPLATTTRPSDGHAGRPDAEDALR